MKEFGIRVFTPVSSGWMGEDGSWAPTRDGMVIFADRDAACRFTEEKVSAYPDHANCYFYVFDVVRDREMSKIE